MTRTLRFLDSKRKGDREQTHTALSGGGPWHLAQRDIAALEEAVVDDWLGIEPAANFLQECCPRVEPCLLYVDFDFKLPQRLPTVHLVQILTTFHYCVRTCFSVRPELLVCTNGHWLEQAVEQGLVERKVAKKSSFAQSLIEHPIAQADPEELVTDLGGLDPTDGVLASIDHQRVQDILEDQGVGTSAAGAAGPEDAELYRFGMHVYALGLFALPAEVTQFVYVLRWALHQLFPVNEYGINWDQIVDRPEGCRMPLNNKADKCPACKSDRKKQTSSCLVCCGEGTVDLGKPYLPTMFLNQQGLLDFLALNAHGGDGSKASLLTLLRATRLRAWGQQATKLSVPSDWVRHEEMAVVEVQAPGKTKKYTQVPKNLVGPADKALLVNDDDTFRFQRWFHSLNVPFGTDWPDASVSVKLFPSKSIAFMTVKGSNFCLVAKRQHRHSPIAFVYNAQNNTLEQRCRN